MTVQIRAASRAVARAVGVSFADKFSGAQYVTSVTDGDGTVEALPGPAAGAPEIATTLLTSRQHGLTTRHCSRCRRWVFGLRPWYRPRPGELVTCDHPLAVEVARDILEREKLRELAAQMRPRPVMAQGAGFNPNTCAACGHQADWRALDDVIIRAVADIRPIRSPGWIPAAIRPPSAGPRRVRRSPRHPPAARDIAPEPACQACASTRGNDEYARSPAGPAGWPDSRATAICHG